MKLGGAVIAVTGGASGLGAATAQECLERGAAVAVLDMNKAPVAPVAPVGRWGSGGGGACAPWGWMAWGW